MSTKPITQIAISTIKDSEKYDIYPKTVDKAIITTDSEGNETTLDKMLVKTIKFNGTPNHIGENNEIPIDAPVISSIETEESDEDGGANVVTITMTDGEETTFNVLNGSSGKSAYECYLETTEDNPPMTEEEWLESLEGEDGVDLGQVAIADNCTTNDATKVLSAKQGYNLKGQIDAVITNAGGVVIPRWSGVPDGKYYKKSVGEQVIKAYYSSNASYRTYYIQCSKGDVVFFGTKKNSNVPAWLVVDTNMYVLSSDTYYNGSTAASVPNLTINDDDAAYIIINSIGETNNYIGSSGSLDTRLRLLSESLDDQLYTSKQIVLHPVVFNNTRVLSNGKLASLYNSISYEVSIKGLNLTQVRIPTENQGSGVDACVGFILSDGSWENVWNGAGQSGQNTTRTFDVPSGAVKLKGCCTINQDSTVYGVTSANTSRFTMRGQQFVDLKDNRGTLMSVVESNKTGRFAYNTVGVMDYYRAFDELAYTFNGFTKLTKIGDSQAPLSTKSDLNTYPINHYRYTKPGVTPTKKFVLAGGLHGDSEGWTNNGGDAPQNIITIYFFLQDMLLHCEDDPFYKELTDNYIIEVLPIMNPWGVQNHSRYNGRDVDLNRQFPNNWDANTSEHKGTEPLCEAESQALYNFITGLGNFDRYIEVHARGEVLIPSDNRFFGVCASNRVPNNDAAAYYMLYKYGGQGGFSGETANPCLYSWIDWVLGIPGCDIECCQSLANDVNTRHSKLLNLQMTDYVKWCILMQLGIA